MTTDHALIDQLLTRAAPVAGAQPAASTECSRCGTPITASSGLGISDAALELGRNVARHLHREHGTPELWDAFAALFVDYIAHQDSP